MLKDALQASLKDIDFVLQEDNGQTRMTTTAAVLRDRSDFPLTIFKNCDYVQPTINPSSVVQSLLPAKPSQSWVVQLNVSEPAEALLTAIDLVESIIHLLLPRDQFGKDVEECLQAYARTYSSVQGHRGPIWFLARDTVAIWKPYVRGLMAAGGSTREELEHLLVQLLKTDYEASKGLYATVVKVRALANFPPHLNAYAGLAGLGNTNDIAHRIVDHTNVRHRGLHPSELHTVMDYEGSKTKFVSIYHPNVSHDLIDCRSL